ncbi:PGAP1-like protein-domain-containing protein [Schizophyllum commune]
MKSAPALAVGSLLAVFLLYLATVRIVDDLSPQGCRMSWMSPSYILQADFNSSWTALAHRYSLWLYREVGWQSNQVGQGVPVLFIPGNAGSSHQVRSIASSAARQFQGSPGSISPEFKTRTLKPLDFFAVEFNEDLSAFHGPTVEAETAYTSQAIAYILHLYPPGTQIIVLGHSMGGIVATSLLPSPDISAVMTMSTPHTLPPARFDARIDAIYDRNRRVLEGDPTPIVSLCGGATDMMIPSESCVLPAVGAGGPYRRTVFSSALEGAWTGVGHREMVWCHQVRWRVARAALELGGASTPAGRVAVLDQWLRDGHTLPAELPLQEDLALAEGNHDILPTGAPLVLTQPRGSKTYLLPIPADINHRRFVLYVSQGSVLQVSPQKPLPLRASVYRCSSSSDGTPSSCTSLPPTTLKLIPNPILGKPFPVPSEGTDESEGVVLYEAEVDTPEAEIDYTGDSPQWIAVNVEDADGRGWVVGGWEASATAKNGVSTLGLVFGGEELPLREPDASKSTVELPNLLSHALFVYRVTPLASPSGSSCKDSLLPPLLSHTSHPSETHYFPLRPGQDRSVLLHTHLPAPYIHDPRPQPGIAFSIYSSGSAGCQHDLAGIRISIDWPTTVGRWTTRYFTTLATWCVAIVVLTIFVAWSEVERTGVPVASVSSSLEHFIGVHMRKLVLACFVISFAPLPESFYLGTRGEPLFAPISTLLIALAGGLVYVSWWLLVALMWPIGKIARVLSRPTSRPEKQRIGRYTALSMGLVFILITFFVPWQVAYLGCWLIHLYTCATSRPPPARATSPALETIALASRDEDVDAIAEHRQQKEDINRHNHSMHILLLMTWLLPLSAPVLVVWVRTLATAGLTTPFDGDHFFGNVAPFLVLVDFASWTRGPLLPPHRLEEKLSARWAWVILAGIALFVGPRRAYTVFNAANTIVGLLVVLRIGRRYLRSE